MAFLTESMMSEIQSICEKRDDDGSYWPLIRDHQAANSSSDKRKIENKIATKIQKDLAVTAKSLAKSGVIEEPGEYMTAVGWKLGVTIKSFYKKNKHKPGENITGFLSLMKTAAERWLLDELERKDRSKRVVARAKAVYGSGEGFAKGGRRLGRSPTDAVSHKPTLGREEKRAVRRAIANVLKGMNKERAEFIKELIGWSPTKDISPKQMTALMKKSPREIIKIGDLADKIAPGPKGKGFKKGSMSDALKTLGSKRTDKWINETRKKFTLRMCSALWKSPATRHLFIGQTCDELGATEAVESLLSVSTAYLSEDSAVDMLLKFFGECCLEE